MRTKSWPLYRAYPSQLISLSITKGREMKEGKEIGASFIFK